MTAVDERTEQKRRASGLKFGPMYDRMERALQEFEIDGRGIHTTIPFHLSVLADEQFRSGEVSTNFLEGFMERQQQVAAA